MPPAARSIAPLIAPLIVFLHEGLGSAALWGGWPQALCAAAGCRGLVFSRYGYGRSDRRPAGAPWPPDYLEVEARLHLPALFAALGIDPARQRVVLFGHSDGASIALLYAAAFPQAPERLLVLAPHVFTETVALERIARLQRGYAGGPLQARLAALHDDPDGVFLGWSNVWLSPPFRHWDVTASLGAIACPALAVQGVHDQYGTLAQLDAIARHVARAELLVLDDCRHVPHEEQPAALLAAAVRFLGAS